MGSLPRNQPVVNLTNMATTKPKYTRESLTMLLTETLSGLLQQLDDAPLRFRVDTLNTMRLIIHEHSPFAAEPVDCIQWVDHELVHANDYNPNSVAPPEMKLLEVSIGEDGYTQPIVAWQVEQGYEVVDGFHRTRVGTESKEIRSRVMGYLPLTIVNTNRVDRGDRIAATVRHNRARGKHRIDAMSDIVIELKRRNWTDEKIGKQLGMEPDEILRLTQITGLAEMFLDQDFSRSWDVDDPSDEAFENYLDGDDK